MTEAIGFIGLGALGTPIVANLLDCGITVSVHNRTPAKADPLVARGALRAERPIDAAAPGGIVATLLWDDASVEAVTTEAFLERLGEGGVHVSMSTISPAGAARLAARHAAHGVAYVEAPIFGRPEAAIARGLWIATAGPAEAKARVRPLLDAMRAAGVFDFGERAGAAAAVKLTGNFLIIAATTALAEALPFARANGLDPQSVVDMLTATLFPAPIYRSYGARIAAGNAPAGLGPIPAKDLDLFTSTAASAGSGHALADFLAAHRTAPP